MESCTVDISSNFLRGCIELSDKRILVIGVQLIKIYSLRNYQELQNISSESENWNLLVTRDKKFLFLSTSRGLKQYSLSNMNLIKVHHPSSNGYCLHLFASMNKIVFNNDNSLLSFDLSTSAVAEFQKQHTDIINSITSTSDEKFFFTTGSDKSLIKWSTSTSSVVKWIGMNSSAFSSFFCKNSNSVFVGMKNGLLSEFSTEDLSLIRNIALHNSWIRKIISLSFGNLMSCSNDGYVKFPFISKQPIKVSENFIYSITELSDKTIACCCDDGLKILNIYDDLLSSRFDSISLSLESVRKSSSPKEPQLISLLQHHLFQLTTPILPQQKKLTGLLISLLPDLKWIQKSHVFEETSEGRKRIFTQKYFLEMVNSKSTLSDFEARLILFDRKLKYLGTVTNENDPLSNFKIKQITKSNWIFKIKGEKALDLNHLYGETTVDFTNGYLNCYVIEGDPLIKSDFQATLKVDGYVKAVISIGSNGVVVTSDLKIYLLNIKSNRIENMTY